MAFHYSPRGDSDNSDDDTRLDLSAWQASAKPTTATRPQPAVPTAPMMQPAQDGSGDELATSALAAFHSSKRRKLTTPPSAPPSPPLRPTAGFSAINRPTPTARPSASRDASEGAAVVVPIIPRVEQNDEDVLDLTAGDDVVRRVLAEVEDSSEDGALVYRVEFEDWRVEERAGFVSTVDAVSGSDRESSGTEVGPAKRSSGRKRKQTQTQYEDEPEPEDDDEAQDEDDSEEDGRTRRRGPHASRRSQRNPTTAAGRSLRSTRASNAMDIDGSEDDDDDDLTFLRSDLPGVKSRKSRTGDEESSDGRKAKRQRAGDRRSGRATRHQGGMQEVGETDIFRRASSEDSVPAPPKPVKASGAREAFNPLPRNDEFRMRHTHECEVCGQGPNFAQLIYCQGCTLAYHKSCLGHRGTREHLVTKVGEGDFVLQCRRCVAYPKKKDPVAPDQGKCSECHEHGHACKPFRPRKTPMQEQKERDENEGVDPAYEIHESRVNNADNVLFRCLGCWRAFHFEHLPSKSDQLDIETDVDVEQRFREYSREWKCKECINAPAKVAALIAWKPVDEDSYDPALSFDEIEEDEKVYLVKWDAMSYFRALWLPGAWVWGTTTVMMRKAFGKREEAQHPKMRTEDAIPEDYLRTDIVLDIKFTSIVDIRTEEVDKARIREVDKALIKYRGLGYEDAVWEAPPSPEDGDRWSDFVMAYNDWVAGRYTRPPTASKLKKMMDSIRGGGGKKGQDFSKLEKKTQPENLNGGELMKYQIEGLNWLYYKWFTQKNAILADEMGLGKTIQIIGFLATMVQEHNCFPFLIVVPNSTCPNWRREIKRWAPTLRVVAYYGSKESRDLAYRYELFPGGSKDLRCHIVVTSYDAAADENCRKFFRSVLWQGLIVDEGQRLKNDKNLLYAALGALKAPFRILLTGTPLQNNQRELFNLLHFLDESYNAAELEERFALEGLTADKIQELHDLIRPFFLRRTKAQVLTFLPPMGQIIVPVSMTIVQKKLYRTILAKNPDLMRAIFSAGGPLKQGERASLSNILMQLRKCLCHPFVYSKGIEERDVSLSASHRNLVDASSKLKLLELLLPKLRERGHRVLIFSQFLDMLDIVEDFMDGMSMPYQRLDGTISALNKQKRIDEFNAPESPLFAFLLSTRAGGVGINLASADTVIILDPDFNPHQDIQALSRAHRIGQTKKVLCFQLVTRASAEERIMQMGRKKLALDHVLIQNMDADDAEENDLVSVLRHGAHELFEDEGEGDITYDTASVERLLDRSHMENTNAGEDKSAETQFSVARVWANRVGALQDEMLGGEDGVEASAATHAPDPGVWANILKERERVAADEATAKAEAFGRGRRARGAVDYLDKSGLGPEGADGADLGPTPKKTREVKNGDESDTDFQAEESADDVPYGAEGENDQLDDGDLGVVKEGAKRETGHKKNGKNSHLSKGQQLPTPAISPPKTPKAKAKARTTAPKASSEKVKKSNGMVAGKKAPTAASTPRKRMSKTAFPSAKRSGGKASASSVKKRAAKSKAGVEYCNLCGMAHFGHARVCPHIQSETQVRAMLEALRHSNEPEHLVNEAKRYLRGLKGNLVHMKKQKEAKEHAAREAEAAAAFQAARAPVWTSTPAVHF
ncbi:hypothetical protein B0A55_08337 [Friedmanniomyces simplex]|uniref:Chromatin remodeling factor mit1 n=1 Tax=Friedmanniomyces simplex TaxID=329884 RepID=A0A4U0X5E0_9PEZI|nr:hypothetical protein B0A55_08337 [Friedmanniomyces simplex]